MGKAERWMDRQARSVQQEDPTWLYTAVRSLTGGPEHLAQLRQASSHNDG